MLDIPEGFARTVIDREGAAGRDWVRSLPDLIDDLLRRWRCEPAAPITHGQVGVILPVRRADGVPAVLKISLPHPGNVHEPHAFAAWDGRGAVRLYERDDERYAMLLERAERQTLDALGDVHEATAIIGRLARRLAVPAPPSLPRLSDRAPDWERALLEEAAALGHPHPCRVVDAALATIRELGREQPDTVVHGDLHFGNVVCVSREPWLVVDPKGLAGDPASDVLVVLARGIGTLRTAADPVAEARRRIVIFADAAEIERERAIRWAQALAVRYAQEHRRKDDPKGVTHLLDRLAEALA